MKKLALLLCLFMLAISVPVIAQVINKSANTNQQPVHRCGTEEAIERLYLTDPMFKAMWDQREREFQQWKAAHPNGVPYTEALTGPVTIPVVVHIVLPNPNVILESDVEYLINRLNLDFSGLNPDSTNGVAFYGVRGHSLIRFCLARRDPAGNFTSGIERRVGAGNIGGGEPQAIKSFASGGLDPWNTSLYYNIWVGQGGGLLGIAPAIGPGTATNDGVCLNYQAFANNPCYTIGAFNLGRTAVHEIGHNFGLWHTFQGGCSNLDMQQLTSPGCALPAPVLALPDDTPGQSAATSGCPVGTVAAGCAGSPNPPGKQYQNYMDYTDDACYSMFSNTQVERMHWVLENCRAGYLTSNGCVLPASTVPLDAAISEIVSPGGSEMVGCTLVTYTVTGCVGTFAPKVRVQNRGSTTLTSVTVELTLNGTPLGPQTFPVNLAYGKSTVVTLSNATLASGLNNLSFTVSAPNGGADGNAANNTMTTTATFTPPAGVALPQTQDFVAAGFPPANLTVNNPNANVTWVRNNAGNGNAGSAFIDNYNFNLVGQIDELRTVALNTAGVAVLNLGFDLAHKNFPGLNDRLQVMYSTDCGATWLPTSFDRSGATLATAGSSTSNYTTPAAADWVRQNVAMCISAPLTFVQFRMTNGYGNNIFIDNIALQDGLLLVNNPGNQTVCNGSPTAAITFSGSTVPGTVYNWTNNTPSIGLGASGSGNIASFNAVNSGTAPVVATITVTPVAGSCSGTPVSFTITVNPTPTVNAIANQTVCNNTATTAVNFTGAVAGTIYNWTNNTPSIGLPASGTGNIPSFIASNPTASPVTATITVTPTTNSAVFNQVYSYTGAVQTLIVPAGVTSINIQAWGGQGNANAANTAAGGLGGFASGTLAVTPGETIWINVGSGALTGPTAGFNGGGNGGTTGTCASSPGGGGGGASDVRQVSNILTNRRIVAGGGGGSAGNRVLGCARGAGGGGGGGYYGGGGGSGYPGTTGVVPTGGSQAAGGNGGVTGTTFGATNGGAGALGIGGTGGNEIFSNQAGTLAVAFFGGAGGGLTGASGTQSGANDFTGQSGAGGSSYIGGVTSGITSSGARTGNGQVIISYTLPVTPVICTGTPRTFTITVNPSPVLTCPPNQTAVSAAGQCGAIVNYPPATAIGTPAPTITYSIPSGSFFPSGVTTVTVTATNTCGSTVCTFTVTVLDTQPPTVTCPASITTPNTPNLCSAVVSYNFPSFTDNCQLFQAPATILAHGAGAITVAGNTLPGGFYFDLRNTTATPKLISSFDVRFGSAAFGIVPSPAPVSVYVTTTANTYVGNQTNQAAWTTIGANIPVTVAGPNSEFSTVNLPGGGFILPPNTTRGIYLMGTASSLVYDGAATSNFNPITNGVLTLTPGQASSALFVAALTPRVPNVRIKYITLTQTGPPSGSTFPVGTTPISYTVTDDGGNTATCSFNVTVNDTQAPTVTCPGNITVTTPVGSCTAVVTYTVTAADNCPGVTTQLVSGPASGSAFPIGTTTVTWRAVDAAGNVSANCSFTVTVNDAQVPAIGTQPANRTVCLGTTAVFSVTATNAVSYQWQSWNGTAWVDIAGATGATYTINNVTHAMNTNSFRVRVNGLCSSVISNHATLYVNALPTISIAASGPLALLPTQTVTLTAIGNPTGGTYVWRKNNTVIPGATASTLGPLTVLDAGSYTVTYTDPNGCVSTSQASVISALLSGYVFVYPNPNNGQFNVRFHNAANEEATITVYNYLGAIIFQQKFITGVLPYSIINVDLGERLAIGTYLVDVRNSKGERIGVEKISVGRQ